MGAAHDSTRMHAMSITPFGADGALDLVALRSHLRALGEAGIGVHLGSYGTGEGRLLRRDELRRLYEIGVGELKGRVPLVAAALGLSDTQLVIELAREAHEIGVDAVQIHPPLPGPATIAPLAAEIERYYADVLGAVRGPIVLSNEVLMVGYSLPTELVARLVETHPQIAAINWTDPDLGSLARLVPALERAIPVRVGLTAQLPAALALGAQGCVSFEPNVAPQLCSSLMQSLEAGDAQQFTRRLGRLLRLNAVLSEFMTPRSVKAALDLLGRGGTALRRPYLSLGEAARERIAESLRELGITGME
jgi:4-hydroxy-tetrahydrodipicolinate synthase